MSATDWAEAERLWRSGAAMDEKLAMVERALAALGGAKNDNKTEFEAAAGRGARRKK